MRCGWRWRAASKSVRRSPSGWRRSFPAGSARGSCSAISGWTNDWLKRVRSPSPCNGPILRSAPFPGRRPSCRFAAGLATSAGCGCDGKGRWASPGGRSRSRARSRWRWCRISRRCAARRYRCSCAIRSSACSRGNFAAKAASSRRWPNISRAWTGAASTGRDRRGTASCWPRNMKPSATTRSFSRSIAVQPCANRSTVCRASTGRCRRRC